MLTVTGECLLHFQILSHIDTHMNKCYKEVVFGVGVSMLLLLYQLEDSIHTGVI